MILLRRRLETYLISVKGALECFKVLSSFFKFLDVRLAYFSLRIIIIIITIIIAPC